jgi:methylenetetrahydrofolate dehydrogenase (NADP+)/methenyltetrahydrofolate cyclohydrolase
LILYGKPVAEAIEEKLKQEIGGLKARGIQPFLAVILVGDNPSSLLYVKKKEEKAEELGIGFKLYHFPTMTSEKEVIELISDLNQNKNIHGLIVQMPLPEGFNADNVLHAISCQKDIEKISPAAQAILEILKFYRIDLKNKKIVLVGHGKLVGEPLEKLLKEQGTKPIICDSKTENLKTQIINADIIISAVGKPGLITAEMVSNKAVIVDAGTAESNGYSVGDVSSDVYQRAAAYSPVPGGVGPVTIMFLMKNLTNNIKVENNHLLYYS